MILNEILKEYDFNPILSYDKVTGQYEIKLEEIKIYASGENREEAIEILLDLVIDSAIDFYENRELYISNRETSILFPYYLKLYFCRSIQELTEILQLKSLCLKDYQEYIENVKATMFFEGKEIPQYCIDLGEKILLGKITGDDARKELAKKHNI